ncbi:MAG: hypothetical protein JF888_02310 [Candidatus Dormibacteraeota bacterium]|uniref:Uncharacterized protein n=1 Tax=Candidatus Dormiibacter inghamiae TaxID=3127013 RepID=A0A934KAW2_9BACT|nr:hypothetical protein [Candidatus Dormibacteraeota bacterium]
MLISVAIRSVVVGVVVVLLALGTSRTGAAAGPMPAPGYDLTTFATGGRSFNPDSVTSGGGHIFVGYQNATPPDGSAGTSTIVEYGMDAKVARSWTVAGKNDGLRLDPFTGKLWATRNEDANPALTIIDPKTGNKTDYSFPAPPHGGGYDDIAFTRQGTFIVASNPATPGAHLPAVQRVTSLAGGVVGLEPILYDDSAAIDRSSGKTTKLALSDPDSLWITSGGSLALTAQADRQVIFIKHPGSQSQRNEVVNVTTAGAAEELDDSAAVKSRQGFLLVVDHDTNTIYKLTKDGGFHSGPTYSQAPKGSPVAGVVGTFDTRTGKLSPVATGFVNPTGLLFVATGEPSGDDQGDNGGGDHNNQQGGND